MLQGRARHWGYRAMEVEPHRVHSVKRGHARLPSSWHCVTTVAWHAWRCAATSTSSCWGLGEATQLGMPNSWWSVWRHHSAWEQNQSSPCQHAIGAKLWKVNWFYLYLKENCSQGVNYAASVSNWSGDIWVCRAYQERLATVEGRLPQWCPKPPQCITGMLPGFPYSFFLCHHFLIFTPRLMFVLLLQWQTMTMWASQHYGRFLPIHRYLLFPLSSKPLQRIFNYKLQKLESKWSKI